MDGASVAVRAAAVPEGSAATFCFCGADGLPGRGPARTTEMCGCSDLAAGGRAAVRRDNFSNRPGDCGRTDKTGGGSGFSVTGASATLFRGAAAGLIGGDAVMRPGGGSAPGGDGAMTGSSTACGGDGSATSSFGDSCADGFEKRAAACGRSGKDSAADDSLFDGAADGLTDEIATSVSLGADAA